MSFQSSFGLVPLGDVVHFINGDRSTNYPKGDDYVDDGTPFISAADLSEGRIDYSSVRRITSSAYERLRSGKIQRDDVLFCLRGSIGKIAYVKEREVGAIASSLVIVRATGKIDPRYLFFGLGSQAGQQAAIGLNNGAAQPNLSVGELQKIHLPVPPLPIQRRIAGILSAYDELIENSQRRIRILETMARALYREWFVHFRFPGHESVPRVPSPLGEIPKGWEVRRLGEILELNYGKALKKEDRHDGPYPVYGSSGIVGTHDASLVKGPGIIVGRKGNVGSVFWCDDDFFVIDTAYFVTSALPLRFLFYVLPTLNFINSDAAVPGLSRHQAYSLELPVPPADLLAKFCDVADSIERHAIKLQRQIKTLRRTRDLLLPRLLSGQIAVEAD